MRTAIFLSRVAGFIFILVMILGVALNPFLETIKAADESQTRGLTLPLNSTDGLGVSNLPDDISVPLNTRTEVVTYRGRRAFRMTLDADGQAVAIVKDSQFRDGTIEAELVGLPRQGAPADVRGFVGISFHVQGRVRFETIYLRMTNGRADDQLRRNHSVQYTSEPEFPWHRLRKENPGAYESYVDLEAGAWTRIKIIVQAVKAALYVNGAEQPCLVINDLKLGPSSGQVALWAGSDTDAYFSNLTITPLREGN